MTVSILRLWTLNEENTKINLTGYNYVTVLFSLTNIQTLEMASYHGTGTEHINKSAKLSEQINIKSSTKPSRVQSN